MAKGAVVVHFPSHSSGICYSHLHFSKNVLKHDNQHYLTSFSLALNEFKTVIFAISHRQEAKKGFQDRKLPYYRRRATTFSFLRSFYLNERTLLFRRYDVLLFRFFHNQEQEEQQKVAGPPSFIN